MIKIKFMVNNYQGLAKGTIHGLLMPILCVFALEGAEVTPSIALFGALAYIIIAGMIYESMSNDKSKEVAAFTFYGWACFLIMSIVAAWAVVPKYGEFLLV